MISVHYSLSNDMKKWRFIFTGANGAFFNMALDEALLLSCQKGDSPPIVRFYLWNPLAISIGYSQSVEKTVDSKKCRDNHISVVRRITGGRAVLHEDEITYTVCASSEYFFQLGENTSQTYQKLSWAWLESLRVLGIDAEWVKPSVTANPPSFTLLGSKPCFISSSRYEITVNGKKLIGSAQRRFSCRSDLAGQDSFIQHGSILTGKGKYSLAEFLPEENSLEMMKRSLEEKSANIEEILKRRIRMDEMISALKIGFNKVLDAEMDDSEITKKELQNAFLLKEKKYESDGWNLFR